jgi:hypothetical protein
MDILLALVCVAIGMEILNIFAFASQDDRISRLERGETKPNRGGSRG